ncbi:hypothetical protein [Kitasatospora kifunensis]|uniref:Uncharacterized protein n=1 Tax=Kitasatospora kifunensis TaxID=58351 RepID=A0A7W7R5Q5_KITKI|nr:hypothetical protein [Kitasatospora kifunensis]MBB4925729.1 hypothetical protein [Kitasatospora kifunensis]
MPEGPSGVELGGPSRPVSPISRSAPSPRTHEAFVRQDAPGRRVSETQNEFAIETLFTWTAEQHHQPSVRGVLVPDPPGAGAGPYCEFAIALC